MTDATGGCCRSSYKLPGESCGGSQQEEGVCGEALICQSINEQSHHHEEESRDETKKLTKSVGVCSNFSYFSIFSTK